MGYTEYSSTARSVRASSLGYMTKGRDEIFTQNREKKIHESMNPKNIVNRESCDSDTHPNTVPIQLFLDVTGSMGQIPYNMIKDGLPKLIGSLIQNGIPDVALMFGAIGDHECDRYPLQIAQFESGDAELDMWLTRTYIEGGGGGNAGESYLLAWYFAANHVKTDAFDKRGKKGYVFTIGDEPTLKNLPFSAVQELMGNTSVVGGQSRSYTAQDLLTKAQEKNHVYHIHIKHNRASDVVVDTWKPLLGQNLIVIDNQDKLAETISKIVISQEEMNGVVVKPTTVPNVNGTKDEEILL